MLEGWHVGGRHRGRYYADNFLNSLLLVLKELSQAFNLNSSDGTIKCAIVGKPSTAVINGNSVVITAESLDHFVRSLFSSCFCHLILLEVIFSSTLCRGELQKAICIVKIELSICLWEFCVFLQLSASAPWYIWLKLATVRLIPICYLSPVGLVLIHVLSGKPLVN